jgi:hypothetical protein
MKWACSYAERSQVARRPAWRANSRLALPPMSCHAVDQLASRRAASSALDQLAPRP